MVRLEEPVDRWSHMVAFRMRLPWKRDSSNSFPRPKVDRCFFRKVVHWFLLDWSQYLDGAVAQEYDRILPGVVQDKPNG